MDKKAKALTEETPPATVDAAAGTTPDAVPEPVPKPADEAPTADEAAVDEVPVEEDEGPAAEGQPAPAVDEFAARMAALEAEKQELNRRVAELKDRLLRSVADFDNFRKRMARQELETLDRARVDALRTFLPVVDNVERALGFTKDLASGEPIAQGLQMVLRSFFEAFASQGLTRVEALGKPFDPTTHEAVGQLETTETSAGCVAQELQSGYLLKGRLLRPALVVVARPPAAAAAAADAAAAAAEPPETEEGTDKPGPSDDGPEGA